MIFGWVDGKENEEIDFQWDSSKFIPPNLDGFEKKKSKL